MVHVINRQTTALINRYGTDVTENEQGFYYSLRQQGYRVTPAVGDKETVYYGGFTVKPVVAIKTGIDALQVELSKQLRWRKQKRDQIIADLAMAVMQFYTYYYSDGEGGE